MLYVVTVLPSVGCMTVATKCKNLETVMVLVLLYMGLLCRHLVKLYARDKILIGPLLA